MRFQVPQNIDISDNIIFGLDFKQMLYLGGGIGLLIFLFLFLPSKLFAAIIGLPVLGFALLLSFFSLNNQPFITIFRSVLRFFIHKKMYIWKQERGEEYVERKMQREEVADEFGMVGSDSGRIRDLDLDLMFDDSPTEDGVDVRI